MPKLAFLFWKMELLTQLQTQIEIRWPLFSLSTKEKGYNLILCNLCPAPLGMSDVHSV